MRDARTKSGFWTKDAEVHVEADASVVADRSTWRTIAVLEVHPRGVPFRIGWRTEQFAAAEFYSDNVQTYDDQFAMEIGDQGVWFVARAIDGRAHLVIELIELTTKDEPRYANTPHY